MLLSPLGKCDPGHSAWTISLSKWPIKHLMPIGQAVIEILSADAVLLNMPLLACEGGQQQ